ncbi:MAG TPA: PRC-barrel domain-containing protein [Burkholderiaceae bacterium]|nr:PRC-barrel domain-containing protein [Burkholderiaceae bacterium]
MAKSKKSVKWMMVPAFGLSLVVGAYAADPATRAGAAGQGPGQGAAAVGQAQPAVGQQQPAQRAAQPGQQHADGMLRMSRLIGMDVRNPQGENLGSIHDVIVDAQSGEARYAVIGFGGFLGLGERLFAYPLQSLQLGPERDRVVLNVPRERLAEAPGFERQQLPDWNDYLRRVDQFHGPRGTGWMGTTATGAAAGPGAAGVTPGTAPAAGMGTPAATASTTAPAAGAPATQTQRAPAAAPTAGAAASPAAGTAAEPRAPLATGAVGTEPGTARAPGAIGAAPAARQQPMPPEVKELRHVRASDLINRNVRDAQMEQVGEIRDIVVNTSSGRLEFAVVAFNRGWFEPDRLVTVPMDAFKRDERHPRDVVLTATRDQLAQAPRFQAAQWPQFEDRDFRGAWDRFLATFRGDRDRGERAAATRDDRPGGTTAVRGDAATGDRAAPAAGTATPAAPATRPATGAAADRPATGAAADRPATGAAADRPATGAAAGTAGTAGASAPATGAAAGTAGATAPTTGAGTAAGAAGQAGTDRPASGAAGTTQRQN